MADVGLTKPERDISGTICGSTCYSAPEVRVLLVDVAAIAASKLQKNCIKLLTFRFMVINKHFGVKKLNNRRINNKYENEQKRKHFPCYHSYTPFPDTLMLH